MPFINDHYDGDVAIGQFDFTGQTEVPGGVESTCINAPARLPKFCRVTLFGKHYALSKLWGGNPFYPEWQLLQR